MLLLQKNPWHAEKREYLISWQPLRLKNLCATYTTLWHHATLITQYRLLENFCWRKGTVLVCFDMALGFDMALELISHTLSFSGRVMIVFILFTWLALEMFYINPCKDWKRFHVPLWLRKMWLSSCPEGSLNCFVGFDYRCLMIYSAWCTTVNDKMLIEHVKNLYLRNNCFVVLFQGLMTSTSMISNHVLFEAWSYARSTHYHCSLDLFIQVQHYLSLLKSIQTCVRSFLLCVQNRAWRSQTSNWPRVWRDCLTIDGAIWRINSIFCERSHSVQTATKGLECSQQECGCCNSVGTILGGTSFSFSHSAEMKLKCPSNLNPAFSLEGSFKSFILTSLRSFNATLSLLAAYLEI